MVEIKGEITIEREQYAGAVAQRYVQGVSDTLSAGTYDVEVKLTPRRWAPDGYHWEGDDLVSGPVRFRVMFVGRAYGAYPEACVEGLCPGLGRVGVSVEAFRAFEKAGLL